MAISQSDVEKLQEIKEKSIEEPEQRKDLTQNTEDPLESPTHTESRPVSESVCEVIRKAVEETSQYQAARDLGYSGSTIHYHYSNQCDHDSAQRKIDQQRCNVIQEMRDDGMIYRKIGEFFGFDYSTVIYHCQKNCRHD